MMDMSSVIDASLAFGGAIAVVLIGISMVSSESTTVSTSSEGRQGIKPMAVTIRLLRPRPNEVRDG